MFKNIGFRIIAAVMVILAAPSLTLATTGGALAATISQPIAGQTIMANQATTFEVTATGGTGFYSYVWNFGDGTQAGGKSYSKTYTTPGQRTVTVVVTDTANHQTTVNLTVNVTSPQASLSAAIIAPTNNQLLTGQATTFEVTATGGTGFYSYVWNFGDGTQAGGKSYSKTYTTSGQRLVTAVVTDTANHQTTATKTVDVSSPTPAPTVDLKADNSDGPLSLTAGASATLTWSTTNATACTASGAWSGNKSVGSSESTGNLEAGNYTYALTCSGPGGSAQDAVTINVTPGGDQTRRVDLKVNDSDGPVAVASTTPLTLTWTTANVDACVASGAWSGNKTLQGTETITTTLVPGTAYTYTLTCAGTSDAVTVQVNTDGGPADQLVITNIRVTDVTQTTAVIHWTTNLPANSRVIYDTVSHSDISAQTAPNFGYANSTATSDDSAPVTEHAVTLTGLVANTQYYFRVLSQ